MKPAYLRWWRVREHTHGREEHTQASEVDSSGRGRRAGTRVISRDGDSMCTCVYVCLCDVVGMSRCGGEEERGGLLLGDGGREEGVVVGRPS